MGLWKKYNSPLTMLSNVYPEYEWLPWKFTKCPNFYWEDVNNQRKFLDWVGKELGIKEFSDWYKVRFEVEKVWELYSDKKKDLLKINAYRFVLSSKPLPQVLQEAYPEYKWEEYKFNKADSKYWKEILEGSSFWSKVVTYR